MKPFSSAIPPGTKERNDNVTWLVTLRYESVHYTKNESKNHRLIHDYSSGGNVQHTT